MVEDAYRLALAEMLKGLLSGTVDLGFNMLPLIASFTRYKVERGWREVGLKTWIENDPAAIEVLGSVLKSAWDKLPDTAKAMLRMVTQE